jgi:WD40 repeat protein
MRKSLLLVFAFLLASSVVHTASARPAQTESFTIRTITVKGLPAYDMKVSPDGRIAALYAGQMATALLNIPYSEYVPDASVLPIHLIDLTTGDELGQLTGTTDYVTDVAFTPDGKQLASCHRNGDIYLWDISAKRTIKRFTSILGGSGKLEFFPDGKTLLVKIQVGFPADFMQWDMETGNVTRIWHKPYLSYGEVSSRTPESMDANYVAFDISPDGSLLATASALGEVALWDTATLQQTVLKNTPEDKNEKIKAMISITSITFSSDGKVLAYFESPTKQTHFWDVASHTETKVLSLGYRFLGISPSGDALAWATTNPKELWFAKADQPDLATKVMDFPDNLAIAATVTFTPDGNQIVVGGFSAMDYSGENVLYVITRKGS